MQSKINELWERIVEANEDIKTDPIKGKQYAPVNQRVKAFRKVYPHGTISTELVSYNEGLVVMKASAYDHDVLLGTGYAYEKEASSNINRTSAIENCETSAVGRCLGFAGFGIDTAITSAEELTNALEKQKRNDLIKDLKQLERDLQDEKHLVRKHPEYTKDLRITTDSATWLLCDVDELVVLKKRYSDTLKELKKKKEEATKEEQ